MPEKQPDGTTAGTYTSTRLAELIDRLMSGVVDGDWPDELELDAVASSRR